MIKQVANLGVMSVLGSPMLLKMIPAKMLGDVIKRVASHYLKSGQRLQEAMKEASEQAFASLDMGLKPTLWAKLTKSKASKEFVERFQQSYLEPFFEMYQGIEREAFCEDGSKACRAILKQLDQLIEPIVPKEEDVHAFFSDGELRHSEERIHDSEYELLRRFHDIAEVKPEFLKLLRHQHVLFQAIHYFFRLQIANDPSVKAIFDELSELKLLRSAEDGRKQRDEIQMQLVETQKQIADLTNQLTGTKGEEHERISKYRAKLSVQSDQMEAQMALLRDDLLDEAQAQWDRFQSQFRGFEDRLGSQLVGARQDIRQARDQMIHEIAKVDIHLQQQDIVLDEIRMLLYQLVRQGRNEDDYALAVGSMLQTSFRGHPSAQVQQKIRKTMAGVGLPENTADRVMQQAMNTQSLTAQRLLHKERSPHAVFELMGQDGGESRSFFLYLSSQVTVGRHSKNDLVLYWYPLPDPPDQTNPQWRDWQHTKQCHPTLNISGYHCDLVWKERALYVRDHSSKGTFVNKERVAKGQMVEVPEGASLALADVLTLSYSILRNKEGQPCGWRLRRMNNYAGREEYLYLDPMGELSVGASSADGIGFSGQGVRTGHLRIRREGEQLVLLPSSHELLQDGQAMTAEATLTSGTRLQVGQQVIWCFPPP